MHLCAVARLTARVVFLVGRVKAWSALCAMRVVFIDDDFSFAPFKMSIVILVSKFECLQESDEGTVSMCQQTPSQ